MGRRPFKIQKVIFSSILRMVVGYLFLTCLFLTVIQENDVLNIFFDVLALEFVEKLDDILHSLLKRVSSSKLCCPYVFLLVLSYVLISYVHLLGILRQNIETCIIRETQISTAGRLCKYQLFKMDEAICKVGLLHEWYHHACWADNLNS